MRVYIDGCFDLAHHGHFEAMRRAKALGSTLVVGVVSDEAVAVYKPPPVLTLEERCDMVRSIRYVDEVLPGVAHTLDEEFTASLRDRHNISLVVHGDDESIMPDGSDPYEAVKREGMFWVIPRTDGISTTDIVRALLRDTPIPPSPFPLNIPAWDPRPDTLYVDGAFDCLHVGHVAFLREARKHGKYVVAGIHADDAVTARRGVPPLMCLEDRARSLMACKYVDGVLPGSPVTLTPSFLKAIKASRVARGAIHETDIPDRDRYKAVCNQLVYVLSPSVVTLETLQRRVLRHRERYERKVLMDRFWSSE